MVLMPWQKQTSSGHQRKGWQKQTKGEKGMVVKSNFLFLDAGPNREGLW